jgi:hypothetical protein
MVPAIAYASKVDELHVFHTTASRWICMFKASSATSRLLLVFSFCNAWSCLASYGSIKPYSSSASGEHVCCMVPSFRHTFRTFCPLHVKRFSHLYRFSFWGGDHCRHKIINAQSESINSRVQSIKSAAPAFDTSPTTGRESCSTSATLSSISQHPEKSFQNYPILVCKDNFVFRLGSWLSIYYLNELLLQPVAQ